MKRIAMLLVAATAAMALVAGSGASGTAAAPRQPFTFFLTHYVLLGDDPDSPTGVRYQSTGRPSAKAKDGSTIALTGKGGWDPAAASVQGGGGYTITSKAGKVTARGTWSATKFVSFLQLPGWWGIDGFEEKGWQGPPGSDSFSGFLKLRVKLDDGRRGLLTSWCIMPTVRHLGGHVSDGISLTGDGLNFSDSTATEMSLEGMMFYGPGSANN